MSNPLFGNDVALTHKWRSGRRFPLEDAPHTVQTTTLDGATVHIIGTAHLASESREHVLEVMNATQPDVLVLEVPPDVQHMLHQTEEEARDALRLKFIDVMNAFFYIGRGGWNQFKDSFLQSRIFKTLDVSQLHEFRAAFNASKKVPGCKVMLADRTTTVTEARMEARLDAAAFADSESEENKNATVADIKKKFLDLDATRRDTAFFMSHMPGRSRIIVTERDQILAYAIQRACKQPKDWPSDCPPVVVAIMGIAHLDGVLKSLGRVKTITPLLRAVADNKGATPATYKTADIMLPTENTKKTVKGKAKSRRRK